MKKFSGLIVFLVGIMIISVFNFHKVEEVFELNLSKDIQTKVINKSNKYIKANLKIPVLVVENKEIENKINKKIEEDIMNFYDNSFKESESYFDDFPESEMQFVVSSEYEIKKNNKQIISLLVKYYKYSGGAHGIYEYVPYNIDVTSGDIFKLQDIFKQNTNYKQMIDKEIKKQVKELNIKNQLPEDSDQLYTFQEIKENQKFYLIDNKLVVFFDLYEIAPYVAGIPEFSIGEEILKDMIDESYKDKIFSN